VFILVSLYYHLLVLKIFLNMSVWCLLLLLLLLLLVVVVVVVVVVQLY